MDSKELIARAQELKAPLDQKRTELQQQIGTLEQTIAQQVAELRAKVKSLHAAILPYDNILNNAAATKNMKGDMQATVIAALAKELEEVANGSSR